MYCKTCSSQLDNTKNGGRGILFQVISIRGFTTYTIPLVTFYVRKRTMLCTPMIAFSFDAPINISFQLKREVVLIYQRNAENAGNSCALP